MDKYSSFLWHFSVILKEKNIMMLALQLSKLQTFFFVTNDEICLLRPISNMQDQPLIANKYQASLKKCHKF
jgi:hypothetical protein